MVLERVLENIQSNGLIAQMKKMTHGSWPLAKVPEQVPRLPSYTDYFCWTAGQLGPEDESPSSWPLLATPSVVMGAM